jgi:hypothetical protein
MDNYLTASCEYDEAHLTEALKTQIWVTQKTKNLILGVLVGGMLLFSLYSWLLRGNTSFQFPTLLCVAMIGMLVYVNLGLPRKTAKAQVPRIRENNGGLNFLFRFREDAFAMLGPDRGEEIPLSYSSVNRIVQSKHLILVFTDARKMLLVDRTSFENGTEADFWTLMAEKCPSAQVKKK